MATVNLYGTLTDSIFLKKIDWVNDTINVALVTSSYTPAKDTDNFWSTPQAFEVTGTGYTAGGVTLGTKTHAYSSGTRTFSAASATWTTSTITAHYGIIYDATPGSAATDPLIAWVDFGADRTSTAGTFQIAWNAAGIFTITV